MDSLILFLPIYRLVLLVTYHVVIHVRKIEHANKMEPYPAIIEFRVVYRHQKPSRKKTPISQFETFEQLVKKYGFQSIHLILFYFKTDRYYPYSIHPIILQRKGNTFEVAFYHYYNVYNQRIELSFEQQIHDWLSLESFLKNQNSVLLSYIVPPFVFHIT